MAEVGTVPELKGVDPQLSTTCFLAEVTGNCLQSHSYREVNHVGQTTALALEVIPSQEPRPTGIT